MEICSGMQGTKTSGHQWNTILTLVLSSLIFINVVIDHYIYTLNKKITKDVLTVECYTDDLLCAYSSTYIFE